MDGYQSSSIPQIHSSAADHWALLMIELSNDSLKQIHTQACDEVLAYLVDILHCKGMPTGKGWANV